MGPTARRVRRSDTETERRMLDAAVALLTERGLTVGVDDLSLEEVIHAAGVARTSVYRRWPSRNLFLADLLVELASTVALGPGYATVPATIVAHLQAHRDHPPGASAEQDQRDFLVELLRVIGAADQAEIAASRHWRTRIALHATHLGLPDGELRDRVGAALARSEQRVTESRARVYQRLVPLAGYRLIGEPEPEQGYRQLSLAVGALATGLVVRSLADPEPTRPRHRLRAFGTSREADWSDAGLAQVRLLLSYLEPDPAASPWGPQRIDALIEAVQDMAAHDAPEVIGPAFPGP
jgi:AcrR family transcriptional regulator